MRIVDRVERVQPARSIQAAGIVCMAAAWIVCMAAAGILAATPALAQNGDAQNGSGQNGMAQNESAQEGRTGVSSPDPAVITVKQYSDDAVSVETVPPVKPSSSVPRATPATAPVRTVDGAYVAYRAPVATGHSTAAASGKDTAAFDPDANIVTEETAGRADRLLLSETGDAAAKKNPDAGIVTRVPSRPGEVPDGTLVKVKLREELSTLTTTVGTSFTAEVSEPVLRDGQVVVPAGALLEGRVTYVRGGKRIGGAAAIHLEARMVTLPDGSQYGMSARVIDTDSWDDTKVDSEGTILRKDHGKATAAVTSLSAGGGMAAGAVMGGVPGALIGAGVGASVSTVVWMRQDRQADLPKDLGVVFSLTEPMRVTPMSARLTRPGVGSAGGE